MTLIEIEIIETGDRAEAETSDAALLAARVLARDYFEEMGGLRTNYTARFTVDGEVIREAAVKSLWTARGVERRKGDG